MNANNNKIEVGCPVWIIPHILDKHLARVPLLDSQNYTWESEDDRKSYEHSLHQ